MSFTRQDKIDLALGLDRWGVGLIEAGIPAMGRAERATLDALHSLGLSAEILVWNRLTDDDLDLCLAAGWPHLHFSIPASDTMIQGKLRRSRAWVLDQVDRVVARAVDAGRTVSLGAEDASRAELGFLMEVFGRAQRAGAVRVRYADTLGILTPDQTSRAVGTITEALSVPLDFHGHDDFGLATANTVAAWNAGAQVLSCSLLGWGERAGNASLEQVAAVLTFLQPGGDPEGFADLSRLCRLASDRAGIPIHRHQPLVGEGVFSHQSGIHIDGLLKDSQTYEAWPPETFGGRRRLCFGKHSGPAALRHFAAQRGVVVDEAEAKEFLEDLREAMGAQSGIDPEAAFEALVAQRRAP